MNCVIRFQKSLKITNLDEWLNSSTVLFMEDSDSDLSGFVWRHDEARTQLLQLIELGKMLEEFP